MRRSLLKAASLALLGLGAGVVGVAAGITSTMPVGGSSVWGRCINYATHAGTTITCDGPTTTFVDGSIGVSPGTSITGSYRLMAGTADINNTPAIACAQDKISAYNVLHGLVCPSTHVLDSMDLAGRTLTPGVWCFGSMSISAGSVTLDAGGDPNAEWVFQTSSTLVTATGTHFILENGAQANNVYWAVGSSATLGPDSSFAGHIIAAASISVDSNVQILGRLIANAAVTFAGSDTVGLSDMVVPGSSTGSGSGAGTGTGAATGTTEPTQPTGNGTGTGPTPPAYIVGDPQFVGLRGQSYQVHGVSGEVYNIVSDADLQYNSKFVFLDSGACPVVNGKKQKGCFSHPGSYLGELGLKTRAGDKIHVVTGSAKQGFASVSVNGKDLEVGETVVLAGDMGSVSLNSTHLTSVQVGNWDFAFENSDMFVNQRVRVIDARSLRSHGLLGQTWRDTTYANAVKYIAGQVDDYVIRDEDIFGDSFVYNAFN